MYQLGRVYGSLQRITKIVVLQILCLECQIFPDVWPVRCFHQVSNLIGWVKTCRVPVFS